MFTKGMFAVSFEYMGDGKFGRYNPDSSKDIPLFRLGVYVVRGKSLESVGSYYTQLPATISLKHRYKAAEIMLSVLNESTVGDITKVCEGLSWLSVEDLEEENKQDGEAA